MRRLLLMTVLVAPITAVAAGGNDSTLVAEGRTVYSETCVACHGNDGKGIMPAIPDFTDPHGPLAKQDGQLLDSITNGMRSAGSPLSMPAKGGNPSLTDADIKAVLAYMRAEFSH